MTEWCQGIGLKPFPPEGGGFYQRRGLKKGFWVSPRACVSGSSPDGWEQNKVCLLVFVHGWGFDASFWQPLRDQLPEYPGVAFDLGFRAQPQWPPIPAGGKIIAVGHSTGFAWLLHERPFRWDALVAINGFSRFVEGPDFRPAVAPQVLERMIRRFASTPLAVATEFLTRCGAIGLESANFDVKALAAGLVWLRDWDERAALAEDPAPLLVLAGARDPIIPMAMTERCFGGRSRTIMHRREGGGHLLPHDDPAWCAQHLRALAKVL
ncbi:MAG: alpha/beta fold hydrolase [Alphaproteobacteria bacterium]|nr:alpha/beta fold hydrolase [Alphaproteobacteria bacterium]